jgi:flagellar biosynthesis chaperone FliJ
MSTAALETLLEVRNRKKEAAAQEVGRWRQAGKQLDAVAQSIHQQLDAAGKPMEDPALCQLQQAAAQRHRHQLNEVQQRRKDVALQELKAQQLHQRAMRDAKALERVVERRTHEEHVAEERRGQNEMEDLFLMAHAQGIKSRVA